MTSKGLRHIQMREKAIQECVQTGFATINHIGGKLNPADIFTKEDKHKEHFLTLRGILLSPPPSSTTTAAARRLLVPLLNVCESCQHSHEEQNIRVTYSVGHDILPTVSQGGVVFPSYVRDVETLDSG
eukprot:15344889-Ditylum_brightwellii.AAC.2